MYLDGVFASFDNLSQKFDLPWTILCHYFQIRYFSQCLDPKFPNMPSPSRLAEILETLFNSRELILRIYDLIASLKYVTIAKIKADWTRELGWI